MQKSNLDRGRGMGKRQSRVVHIRVSNAQADRLEKLAAQANAPLGQVLREALEMMLSDPVNFARAIAAVHGDPQGVKVHAYVPVEEVEAAGQERLPGLT